DRDVVADPHRVAVRELSFLLRGRPAARFHGRRRLDCAVVGRDHAGRHRDLVSGIDWYAARAAGVVAYALLTSGVLLGVLLAGRARLPRWPTFAVTDVHRFVALLTGAFVVLHVCMLLVDRYVHTSLVAVLVPGASTYRPFWVALGTVALELLAAVGVSNLLRKRLGQARWRRIHYLSFVV